MRNPIPYRVECRPLGQAFFEVIAGFNHQKVALHYATDCQVTNQPYDYRVTYRGKVVHDEVYVTAEAILQNSLGAPK